MVEEAHRVRWTMLSSAVVVVMSHLQGKVIRNFCDMGIIFLHVFVVVYTQRALTHHRIYTYRLIYYSHHREKKSSDNAIEVFLRFFKGSKLLGNGRPDMDA